MSEVMVVGVRWVEKTRAGVDICAELGLGELVGKEAGVWFGGRRRCAGQEGRGGRGCVLR